MGHKCFHLISENYDQSPPKFKCTTPSTHTPTSGNIKSITTVFYISWTLTIPSPETSRVHQVVFLGAALHWNKVWEGLTKSINSLRNYSRTCLHSNFILFLSLCLMTTTILGIVLRVFARRLCPLARGCCVIHLLATNIFCLLAPIVHRENKT